MIYFSSDHHYGHKNVITYCNRSYSSIEEMNADLIYKWNSVVKSDDTVYYLGDFSLGKNWVREIAPKLSGEIHLIAGNHDWCHPVCHRNKEAKKLKYEQLYLESGFKSIKLEDKLVINDQEVLLHHMPYLGSGDHAEQERYSNYRPKNNGGWLLHGHVHNLWKQKDKQINVGVDQWNGFPVSIKEIEDLIK